MVYGKLKEQLEEHKYIVICDTLETFHYLDISELKDYIRWNVQRNEEIV